MLSRSEIIAELKSRANLLRNSYINDRLISSIADNLDKYADYLGRTYHLGPSEIYIKKLEEKLVREKFREMWNESVKEYNDAQEATSACQECK